MNAGRGVAVTGSGVLCATASGTAAFATALREGRSGIAAAGGDADALCPRLAADLPALELRELLAALEELPESVRHGALRAAGRAPLPVQASVAVALEAWEAARLHPAPVAPERVGLVVAGHNLGGRHADAVRPRFNASPAHLPARYALHFMDTDHVGTVSQVLGVRGEGYTVGGASASGNVAIVNAARLVACDAVDACLVVGALTDLSAMERQGFFNLGAMAAGACRPFDAAAEGFVPGQAAACLVLEAAGSAARRGVAPAAWVRGCALGLDGNSLADPTVAGEARVMAEALRRAGADPGEVGYVNAHGTGSPLGDRTEVGALGEVFAANDAGPWVNSTKGLVGHCLCSAGVVEAVATVVQLRDGFVHPNALLDDPIDDGVRFASARAEEAPIELAVSNGFGFGGFNTSVVLGRAA